MNTLVAWILGDPMAPIPMMFRPLPIWVLVLGFIFPLTILFAELPTYFGYVMPHLASQLKNGWIACLITSFTLALDIMSVVILLATLSGRQQDDIIDLALLKVGE